MMPSMKTKFMLATFCAAFAIFLGACAKKSEVDTTKLETSFASAEPADKSQSQQIVSSVKAGDYTGALASLQKLASQAKLTPEQKDAIKDVTEQVQKQLGAAIEKAAEGGQKALNDLQKSVPK